MKEKVIKILTTVSLLVFNIQLICINTYAAGIGDSKLFTGTKKLFNDMKAPLIGLSAGIAIVLIVYFLIRIKMSDEQDAKIYKKRIVTVVACCIGIVLASSLLTVILSYYK